MVGEDLKSIDTGKFVNQSVTQVCVGLQFLPNTAISREQGWEKGLRGMVRRLRMPMKHKGLNKIFKAWEAESCKIIKGPRSQ